MAIDEGVRKADHNPNMGSEHQCREMDTVLSRFFDIIFPAAIVFGGIATTAALFRSFRYGLYVTAVFHAAIYTISMLTLLFRRKLPERIILGLLLGLMAVTSIQGLYNIGLASGGLMLLSLLCIFSCLFFGVKGGLISVGAGALAISTIGIGISTGSITMPPDIKKLLLSPTTWCVHLFLFLLFTISLILLIHFMKKRIAESLHSAIAANQKLQLEISTKAEFENELQENESRYRSIVENSMVAFSIVQDGRFRFVNSRFCTMTGYTYEELVDKLGPADIASPDLRTRVAVHCNRLLTGEPISNDDELVVIRKDGTPITVKALGNMFIYRGKPAIFGSLMDITNEKILESKLIQSQKMEAIGTLAGGIAHDFNNILGALMGFGTMLHTALEDNTPLKRYAKNILSASEKAAGLTQSLLTFSRAGAVDLNPVKINSVIKDTEDLLRRIITEDIDVKIDLSPAPIFILSNAIQINQILFNLAANARDAMPRGGSFKISTAIEEIDEHFILENGFGRKGKYCRISVSDSGAGMEKATMDKIFDPFFTTKEIGKGTGIGLSTVYGIVKQHHGYIRVSSTVGSGTSFHLYFPEINEPADLKCDPPKKFKKGHETILVAEDDTTTRCYIRDLLTHYGYRVIEAKDGEDAIGKFRSHEAISLVILDSIMPAKNGKEVYNAIKKQRPDIRALFMSGYPKETVLSKGLLEPDMEFLPKPLYPDKLMEKVEEILGEMKGK